MNDQLEHNEVPTRELFRLGLRHGIYRSGINLITKVLPILAASGVLIAVFGVDGVLQLTRLAL